ncbi:MAG: Holliday junction resolvase RuvX [Patescibacteria group bacterium]
MRLLGIDMGTKKTGLALSDPEGWFALPYDVVKTESLVEVVKVLCEDQKVGKIIIGQSVDYQGGANPVAAKAEDLAKKIQIETGLEIIWEPETLTSKEAERIIGRDRQTDARAAAIILRNYIDRQNYV